MIFEEVRLAQYNVIIIMIDGGRSDRSIMSDFYKGLKEKSVYFSQPVTYAPYTNSSMHAVFSGCYGIRTGTDSYWSTYKFKKNQFKTITEYLHDRDYYTSADNLSKILIPKQGFDEFQIHDELKDDLTLRHSELIEKTYTNNKNKNFFLYLQFSNIHATISNEVLRVYDNFSKEYFQNKKLNEKRYDKLFKKSELYLDKILGKINSLDLGKNSIILVMSDHGISIGEKIGERAYGAFCYDYTLRTFAYFFIPGFSPLEISQQIRTVDFMPSILELLHIPLDKNYSELDGESLLPLIKGQKVSEKIAYSETGNPWDGKTIPKEPNTKSVRTSKWKLIYNEYNNTKELYDLENDPAETNNLINSGLKIEEFLWNELTKIQGIK
jgi:membrane-anchored protein YejM (alkaline phosphatase superfamily)